MSAIFDKLACIEGHRLRLRLVTREDASYIFGLRTDPTYNAHLSTVSGTVADQAAWIDAYKTREAQLSELYYVIERRDGTRCGVVRLYDITPDAFTWGSWILDSNKPAKAALESAVLSFGVGLGELDLGTAHFEARRDNEHAIAFYQRFGAIQTSEDDQNRYFSYPKERFFADQATHWAVIKAAA